MQEFYGPEFALFKESSSTTAVAPGTGNAVPTGCGYLTAPQLQKSRLSHILTVHPQVLFVTAPAAPAVALSGTID